MQPSRGCEGGVLVPGEPGKHVHCLSHLTGHARINAGAIHLCPGILGDICRDLDHCCLINT